MLQELIKIFSSLPGLGPKSAKRIVLQLMENRKIGEHLSDLLNNCCNNLKQCSKCNNISENILCNICSSHKRDIDIICVVDNIEDLWNIEESQHYNGLYYIPTRKEVFKNQTIYEININPLLNRIENEKPYEIILANGSTVKGQTNAFYINDSIHEFIAQKGIQLKITTLGRGIPIGSEIDYLDESTIKAAFVSRRAA